MGQTFANLKSVCLMKQLMCVWGVWFLFSVKISIDIKNKVFEFCPTPAVEKLLPLLTAGLSARCTLMACICKHFCRCCWEYKVVGNNTVFRNL